MTIATLLRTLLTKSPDPRSILAPIPRECNSPEMWRVPNIPEVIEGRNSGKTGKLLVKPGRTL